MQNKYRFIGIRPFEKNEKEIFFERQKETEDIYKSIYFNKITIVHSSAGTGKTSVIKAGILPKISSNKKFRSYYFSIPNFIKNENISPISIINKAINKDLPKNSYLDKIIEPEKSLWYKLKRLEATNDKEIVIILDQFENIFSFSETEIVTFKEELVKALFEQIPQEIREKINNKLTKNPNLLTPKGLEKLYKTINLKLVFVLRTDKLYKLDFFKDRINNIDKNRIEIEQITRSQAKNILQKTASFKTKYNIDDKFIANPFTISEKLTDEILDFLTKNNTDNIETYQLQIIGREIEMISIKKLQNFIDISEVTDFEALYNDYYEAVVNKIADSVQKISARKFIEDELIFEYEHRKLTIYEGLAKIKYKISEQTLDILVENNLIRRIKNNKDEIFYEISHDALITPILMAKDKRIKYEIRIEKELEKKKLLEQKIKAEKKKSIRNKRISILFSILFAFSLILGIIALTQRKTAIKNEMLAKSSLFASFAFKYLNIDPTLSLRYAQKAYSLDKNNEIAVSSLLHAFYKSNIFYSQNINTAIKCDDAVISNDCSKILLVSNTNEDNLALTLINSKGEVLKVIPQPRLMSSVNFSKNSKYIIVSYYNHKTTIFDLKGKIIRSFKKDKGYTLFANLSHDNSKIVTCNSQNTAKILSFDGKLIATLKGHTDEVKYADFSPNDSLIATIGQDAKIIVYNMKGKILAQHTYLLEYQYQSNDFQPVKFFPDGKKILFVVNDNLHFNFQIIVWDYINNKIVAKLNKFNSFINNVNFIDNNTIIASTKKNKAVIINLAENTYRQLLGHTDQVYDAKLDPYNSKIYTISKDQTIKTWKIYDPNKKFEHLKNKDLIKLSNSGIYFAAFNGKNLAVFTLSGDTIFYKHNISVSNLIFSKYDTLLVTFYKKELTINKTKTKKYKTITLTDSIVNVSFYEQKIKVVCKNKLFILNSEGIILSTKELPFSIKNAAFSNNNLCVTNKEEIAEINPNGTIIYEKKIYNIQNIKIASKNSSYAILSIPSIVYFTKNNFKSFTKINNKANISTIEISKTGKYFCIGDTEGNCRVFSNKTDKIYDFKLPGKILSIQFSPNEKTIFIQYFDKYYNKILKQFVIEPSEIINYIDNLKLYGKVFKPKKLDFSY